jgi:hypothetical protein
LKDGDGKLKSVSDPLAELPAKRLDRRGGL